MYYSYSMGPMEQSHSSISKFPLYSAPSPCSTIFNIHTCTYLRAYVAHCLLRHQFNSRNFKLCCISLHWTGCQTSTCDKLRISLDESVNLRNAHYNYFHCRLPCTVCMACINCKPVIMRDWVLLNNYNFCLAHGHSSISFHHSIPVEYSSNL